MMIDFYFPNFKFKIWVLLICKQEVILLICKCNTNKLCIKKHLCISKTLKTIVSWCLCTCNIVNKRVKLPLCTCNTYKMNVSWHHCTCNIVKQRVKLPSCTCNGTKLQVEWYHCICNKAKPFTILSSNRTLINIYIAKTILIKQYIMKQ